MPAIIQSILMLQTVESDSLSPTVHLQAVWDSDRWQDYVWSDRSLSWIVQGTLKKKKKKEFPLDSMLKYPGRTTHQKESLF